MTVFNTPMLSLCTPQYYPLVLSKSYFDLAMFGGLLPDSTLTGSLDVSFKSLLEVKCGQAKMVYYLLQQFVKINMV